MKEEKDIIHILETAKPEISPAERARVWSAVSSKLPLQNTHTAVPSPYVFSFMTRKVMVPLSLALILIIGGGGTALASDAARPGDFLFPLERTLENIQLRLAVSDDSRETLTRNLTEERLRELREIIDEEVVVSGEEQSDSGSGTSTQVLSVEADVFTDVTVVTLELRDKKFYFESTAKNREGVIIEIVSRFPMLTAEEVSSQLDFEIKDRMSRPKDRGVVTLKETGEVRISKAVDEILSFLDETRLDDSRKDVLLQTLSSEVESVTKVHRHNDRVKIEGEDSRYEIRVDDDGDSRVEIRDGGSRIRIEEKDGEIRIDSKRESESDNTSEDLLRETLSSGSRNFLEIEADVFADSTLVELELHDEKFSFETDSRTRAEVIADIHDRFPELSIEQISAEIDFEIEDRVQRSNDDDSNDDSWREQEDDDEDEHGNSGRGGGDDDRDDEDEDDDDSSGHGKGGGDRD